MKTLLSIIIPIYNVDPIWLTKCINSIEANDLKNIEIIFINDASTNLQTLSFIDELRLKYKVIDNKFNLGLGKSRNIGLKNCTGEYIWFIDADDWISDDAFSIIKNEILNDNSNDFFSIHFAQIYEDKRIIFERDDTNSHLFSAVWTRIYNKNFLTKNNLTFIPENIYHEDEYFTGVLHLLPYKFKTIKSVLYFYNRCNSNSITYSKDFIKRVNDLTICFKYIYIYINNYNINIDSQHFDINRILFLYLIMFYHINDIKYRDIKKIRNKYKTILIRNKIVIDYAKSLKNKSWIYKYLLINSYKQPFFYFIFLIRKLKSRLP